MNFLYSFWLSGNWTKIQTLNSCWEETQMNSIKLNVHLEILLSSLQEYTQILICLDTLFPGGKICWGLSEIPDSNEHSWISTRCCKIRHDFKKRLIKKLNTDVYRLYTFSQLEWEVLKLLIYCFGFMKCCTVDFSSLLQITIKITHELLLSGLIVQLVEHHQNLGVVDLSPAKVKEIFFSLCDPHFRPSN